MVFNRSDTAHTRSTKMTQVIHAIGQSNAAVCEPAEAMAVPMGQGKIKGLGFH
jgi:hypothetical protein